MVGLIITIVLIGLIAGALARLLVPGRQDISIAMTIVLGIVGSFVGGFLGYVLFHKDGQDGFLQPSGLIGSVIGAVLVLLVWSRVGGRSAVRR
ncbi:MAG: transglycosylase [Pseudonocardiales bacterium]|nr:transglycosylase [Jatrophihabitantaceae bacterium]MCW2602958.1 transglycosylase [Pseudonocardiales bacterium]